MPKLDHFADQLTTLGRNRRLRQLTPRHHRGLVFEQSDRLLVNFGSNDYLGLAHAPPPSSRSDSSVPQNGVAEGPGSGASPLVCGWTTQHQQLADRIAQFESTESSVLFPSGFAACSGVISTLPSEDDLILSDQLNHASLIDGCRWSKARREIYPHLDVDAVARLLEQHHQQFSTLWIVTDGVFSMDGHVAPLRELCDLADRYNANLIVDEAHATGVLGDRGCGVCEALGVKDRVPVRVGTLSKAMGVQGGFVAGPQVVIDYLINRCRPLIYSTSLAPTMVAAALDSLTNIQTHPNRRHRVQQLARRVHQAVGSEPRSDLSSLVPIVALIVGDESQAIKDSESLAQQGFYVPAIRPPTVPEGTSRLRISLSASHTDEMVDGLIEAIRSLTPGH